MSRALSSLDLMNRALTVPNVNYELTNKAYSTIKQELDKLDKIKEVVDYIFIVCGCTDEELINDEVFGKKWVKIKQIIKGE